MRVKKRPIHLHPNPGTIGVMEFFKTRSIILLVFGGLLLVLAIYRLHRFRLRERYAVLFFIIALPFLVLAFWPLGIMYIADRMELEYNTFMLLCISIFLILTVFELLTIVSVQDRKITTLAQAVAIISERQNRLSDSGAENQRLAEHRDTSGQAS